MDPTERNIHDPNWRRRLISHLGGSYAIVEIVGILDASVSMMNLETVNSLPTWTPALATIITALFFLMYHSDNRRPRV